MHIFNHALLHADQHSASDFEASLDAMLNRWGFTSVFDIASVLDNTNQIRDLTAAGKIRAPRILTVGEPFFPLSVTPAYIRDSLAAEHVVGPRRARG